MNVALEIFKSLGYDNVSVDRITKESKTPKGSFYQHFSSKSNIFMMRFKKMNGHYVQSMRIMSTLFSQMKIVS
ncbi:TetR/AcrR family transcriptional regulator [Lysinibacillus sphaericus]|uniref:TetR/AcrR family transcriptional regulator n=1 Tax=Lysinibacillus sphaericus TaxID=1421 RepID=A0A544V0U8_LYSSH|nr:TetR/AcrR family transcriptional regulator [Lysinibacillus sp. SDF0037]